MSSKASVFMNEEIMPKDMQIENFSSFNQSLYNAILPGSKGGMEMDVEELPDGTKTGQTEFSKFAQGGNFVWFSQSEEIMGDVYEDYGHIEDCYDMSYMDRYIDEFIENGERFDQITDTKEKTKEKGSKRTEMEERG